MFSFFLPTAKPSCSATLNYFVDRVVVGLAKVIIIIFNFIVIVTYGHTESNMVVGKQVCLCSY